MTIGFDGSRSFIKHKTGTENYAYQLLKHLAQIDKQNKYIVYLRPGNEVDKGEWPENFEFKMLEYPRLWTQFGLAKQTFKENLDVLFVPSHTLPLIRKPGLKTIMTVHDLGAEYLPGMHQLKQQLYLGLMTKIQLKTASKLIAVSFATKKDLVSKIGLNSKKVEVVYEGLNSLQNGESLNKKVIDKKINDIEKGNQIIINNKLLYTNRYFLFVGTIQPRKNLARLIKAYAGFLNVSKTKDIKMVLAGGKGWLSEEIYALPKKMGIEELVIFTGRVSDEDLPTLYKNALAFTFPSLFEGFGLPVLEAFESKIPVITSNNSSLPEVAGEAALLVDPYKTEELLDAMLKLYNDKDLQKNLVHKGSEQLKKFSWQKCAGETLKVLETV